MKKIMLAMSGGVDSSVALLLLKNEYDLVGATMKLFGGAEAIAADAEAVAASFDIPHHTADLQERFKEKVIGDFVHSYAIGETPNPCVVCNRHIKFGAFLDFAEKLGCEGIATGHYARIEYDTGSKRYLLKKAASAKDQSYVLYGLSQAQLGKIIFPLGELDKNKVREIAHEHGLTNSNKPDSQDICFIPDGDYARYIIEYTGKTPESGNITDASGRVLGTHSGIINYTVGQRKGLGISAPEPLYVISKSAESNTVTVGGNSELFSNTLTARNINWIAFEQLSGDMRLYAKTRYSQPEQPCSVSPLEKDRVRVIFDNPLRAITPGQSVVFYDGDVIVGGGIIEQAGS